MQFVVSNSQLIIILARFLPNLGLIIRTMNRFLILLALLPFGTFAQMTMFGYTDFNQYFKSYVNGNYGQIEYQEVSDVGMGDEFIVYKNSQKDFKVFNGLSTKLLTNQMVHYKHSDHLIAWNINTLLYYYENGKPHNITSFGGEYAVSDSLIVYQDTRFYTLNVIYKGEVIQLMQQTAEMFMPDLLGENMVVFRDNGNVYKVFWRGEIYELGVWNGNQAFQFFTGTDMVAFNDPQSRTFAIFENGAFLDVEDMHAKKVKVGRGFVVYEDNMGNLKKYQNGQTEVIASYFTDWDAYDDVVIWNESNSLYTLVNGAKTQVAGYAVTEWKLKNDVIAIRNQLGGVSVFQGGKLTDITNITNTDFDLNGHGVMVHLMNKSVICYSDGKILRD